MKCPAHILESLQNSRMTSPLIINIGTLTCRTGDVTAAENSDTLRLALGDEA